MIPPGRACRLTPAGRGAVATIGVWGNVSVLDSHFRAANSRLFADQPERRICFGHWGDEASEDVVCLRTAADAVEIHCHGGLAAVDRILHDLSKSGCEVVSQTEWQKRAGDELNAECARNVARVTTRFAMHHALRQQTMFADAVRTLPSLPVSEALESIDTMLHWGKLSQHLLSPWKVVLCGPPNVGKSSLINALVGYERTVVFDQPGTTRDVVEVETALQGWPVSLSDTAGIREAASGLEAEGISRAKARLETADLILIIDDGMSALPPQEREFLSTFSSAITVRNKSDLNPVAAVSSSQLQVSALSGQGIPELIDCICRRLIPCALPEDQAFPISDAQVAHLNELREEIASSVARRLDSDRH